MDDCNRRRVGVVGLGMIGTRLGDRLVAAGHDLVVWNRSPSAVQPFVDRGALAASHPRDVWDSADICLVTVYDDQALESVALSHGGLLTEDEPAQAVLIDLSTVSVSCSQRVAAQAESAGVAFLRSPVLGNPNGVATGEFSLVVSGPRDAYERVERVLDALTSRHFYVGPGDEARVLKLALNLLLAGTTQLLAEAIVLADANGLDRQTTLTIMSESGLASPFLRFKLNAILADDYQPTFPAAGMVKDLDLILASGREVGAPLPATELVRALMWDCVETGLGDLDFMAVLLRLEREAGRTTPS